MAFCLEILYGLTVKDKLLGESGWIKAGNEPSRVSSFCTNMKSIFAQDRYTTLSGSCISITIYFVTEKIDSDNILILNFHG